MLEPKTAVDESSALGRGNGGGTENTLDARRRAPPGEIPREAIATGMNLVEVRGKIWCADPRSCLALSPSYKIGRSVTRS